MSMLRLSSAALLAVALSIPLGAPAHAEKAAAGKKEPPACAAISFRPIPSGSPDGEQDAGLYKSRFGKIEVKATVKGGLASNYYMVVVGKKVEGPATPPKVSESCLKSKNVAVPFQKQPAGACTGTRFRVVVDRSGGKSTLAFFGLQGSQWAYCSATTV